jgi:hypothetical protein
MNEEEYIETIKKAKQAMKKELITGETFLQRDQTLIPKQIRAPKLFFRF